MQAALERREWPRQPIQYAALLQLPTDIPGKTGRVTSVRVVNASLGGLEIAAPERLPHARRLPIYLSLGRERLLVMARVAWECESTSAHGGRHLYGMVFVPSGQPDVLRLLTLRTGLIAIA